MAVLSSADINNLPDSDFAYIEAGGTKDSGGKTVPRSLRHFPIHDAAHVRNALARAPQSPFSEKAMPKIRAAAKKFGIDVGGEQQQSAELPLAGLCVRAMAIAPTFELRNDKRTLHGHLAVFDEWAEVNSRLEGRFMERMQRGAFTRTLRDNGDRLRVLFNHGEDPQIGFKPLGRITSLQEDQRGVAYEVELFDVDYVQSLLPALEAGQFGSSFTFRPLKDKRQVVSRPQRSDFNPEGIPEVTVQELNMREFGPCMFPVYAGTTAGLRSMTDEFVFGHLASDPVRLRELLTTVSNAPIIPAAIEALSTVPSRGNSLATGQSRNVQPSVPVRKFHTSEDFVEWLNSKT
jgi:HK97 family phage prohead protease